MRFEITDPCEEPWESMEPRDGGRYCGRCEKVVIDLATMSRAEAERRVAGLAADEVCVQLAVDRFGDAVFVRPPPSRAPHWAAGLVLVSALTAGTGCATEESGPCQAKIVQVEPDLGPPMTPVVLASVTPPTPATGPVPAEELVDPTDDVVPTPEQRALTAAKHAPPPIHMVRGRMPLHRPMTFNPGF